MDQIINIMNARIPPCDAPKSHISSPSVYPNNSLGITGRHSLNSRVLEAITLYNHRQEIEKHAYMIYITNMRLSTTASHA